MMPLEKIVLALIGVMILLVVWEFVAWNWQQSHEIDDVIDQEPCEGCGAMTEFDELHSSEEGCWLCDGCHDAALDDEEANDES